MSLRQLLLNSSMSEIKEFFRNAPPSASLILIAVTLYIKTFPEEMRTREMFAAELKEIKNDPDFSDFPDVSAKALSALAVNPNWASMIDESLEVIKCL